MKRKSIWESEEKWTTYKLIYNWKNEENLKKYVVEKKKVKEVSKAKKETSKYLYQQLDTNREKGHI